MLASGALDETTYIIERTGCQAMYREDKTVMEVNPLGQFLKVWWMASWRLLFLSLMFESVTLSGTAIILGAIISAVIIIGLHRTVRVWPIIQILRNSRNPLFSVMPFLKEEFVTAPLESEIPRVMVGPTYYPQSIATNPEGYLYNHRVPRNVAQEHKSVERGTITEYNPKFLNNIPIPESPIIYGTPGKGLDSSGFSDKNVTAGKTGEENFAKALAKAGLINKFQSFWSVSIGDENLESFDDTDIDCVLLSNNKLYLIDLKNYRQGNLTYYRYEDHVFAIDNISGNRVGPEMKANHQMQRAENNFETFLRNNGPSLNIVSRVVIMPTSRGTGIVDCSWPGGVEAVTLDEMIEELRLNDSGPLSASHSSLSLMTKLEELIK